MFLVLMTHILCNSKEQRPSGDAVPAFNIQTIVLASNLESSRHTAGILLGGDSIIDRHSCGLRQQLNDVWIVLKKSARKQGCVCCMVGHVTVMNVHWFVV